MAITPTVLGAASIEGEQVLVVAAGENAESLEFAHIPLAEHSPEAYQAAFTQACKDLGFGKDGKKKSDAEEEPTISADLGGDIEGADSTDYEPGKHESEAAESNA